MPTVLATSSLAFIIFRLLIFVAQWTGILALRRSSRGFPWILMIAGVSIGSLMVFWPFIADLLSFEMHLSWSYLPGLISTLGSMLFAVGFAIHGLRSARATERQAELELLVAAMAEDLQRLQGQGTGNRSHG
jgi:hypothetical protein